MRTLATSAVLFLAAACATPPAVATLPTEPDWNSIPIPPESAGQPEVRIYDVSDLVTPAGDTEAVADLASDLRSGVAFLMYGAGGSDALVQTRGTSLVVTATPHVQARIANNLERRRRGFTQNGL